MRKLSILYRLNIYYKGIMCVYEVVDYICVSCVHFSFWE